MRRLFADDFTAGGQLEWAQGARGGEAEFWWADLLGRMRLDALLAERLVVSDGHVFDGKFFLGTRPSELLAKVGRFTGDGPAPVLPLEVRGRRPSLEGSLAALLRRQGSDTLNGFSFKSIEDPLIRAAVSEQLGRTPEASLDRALNQERNVAEAVARVVRDAVRAAGFGSRDDELVEPLVRGWRAWLDESDLVEVEAWPVHRSFDLLNSARKSAHSLGPLRSDVGRDTLEALLGVIASGGEHRSDANALLAPRRAEAERCRDGDASTDLSLLDRWYSRVRYRAFALQHGCRLAVTGDSLLPPIAEVDAVANRLLEGPKSQMNGIEVPEATLTRLGTASNQEYADMHRVHSRELAQWWRSGGPEHLKGVAASLDRLAVPAARATLSPTDYLVETTTVVAAGATAAATLGFGAGTVAAATSGVFLASVGRLGGTAVRNRLESKSKAGQYRIVEAFVDRAEAIPSSVV